MEKLLDALHNLNYFASECSQLLLRDKCNCSKVKSLLITALCHAINRFASIKINIYIYVFPCTQTIKEVNNANNAEQLVRICSDIIKWTAEEINILENKYE